MHQVGLLRILLLLHRALLSALRSSASHADT